MIECALQFECEGSQLFGILHRSDTDVKNMGVVIVVGGPQYRVGSHRQFTLMARQFSQAGYPVLRFDYRGMGDSGGELRGFEHVDADIHAAIDALLRAVPRLEGVVLWGLCDAASACLMYGNQQDARIRGLILANPWVRTQEGEAGAVLKHYYLRRFLQKSFWVKVCSGEFNVNKSAADLLNALRRLRKPALPVSTETFIGRMLRGAKNARIPVLLLISSNDLTAKEFEAHCQTDGWSAWRSSTLVNVIHLLGVDHTFSGRGSVDKVSSECVQWMARL